MKLLNKLERKFGKYAIHNLMFYIVILNIIGFILIYLDPRNIVKLYLIPEMFFAGEYWRVFTFLMIPPTDSIIFFAFVLYFYYLIGNTLESNWGTFKFNAYYFIGVLGTITAALVFKYPMTTVYLNLSLFLAFAKLFPDFTINLYFILPIKIKYLAWIQWGFFIYTLIMGNNIERIAITVALVNYFLFFGKEYFSKQKAYSRKQSFQKKAQPSKHTIHKCTTCGKTEKDDPNLEFRYCSKCNGHYEYCSEHLFSHNHKN
ncbi:hypothetical protein EDC18_101107 [Natranaerovirga pectinivora]|uniref:Membrane associated rhomboid family serine protease n=1 Tax=Natranaerovirga pectinivora TaxID=682400 RepID=A0A4R3MNL8_9FIRM|nr:hypothetical protein [Natranaerovirga pectinivora]TCT16811.1 hypothetical protein EDC18_101107 [Natranaerovirga pectinivora]